MSMIAAIQPGHRVGRRAYLFAGLLLFALKYIIDNRLAWHIFSRSWSPLNYAVPSKAYGVLVVDAGERPLYLVLLIAALPFIWIGVVMTLNRLRDAGLPMALVVLFFVPMINFLLFSLLSILPARNHGGDRLKTTAPKTGSTSPQAADAIPKGTPPIAETEYARVGNGRAPAVRASLYSDRAGHDLLLAVVVSAVPGIALTYLSVGTLRHYGWGLFVGLPFAVSMSAAVLLGRRAPRSFGGCLGAGVLSTIAWELGLLATGFEGIICLMMAFPLALGIAFIGAIVGWSIQRCFYSPREISQILGGVLVFMPLLLGAEATAGAEPEIQHVRTAVVVAAPPEVVWKNVIAFPDLPPPREWYFRTGIAYPVRARINGWGVGATRYCEFSTGAFVEPISVWDEPRLLQFSVTAQAAPLDEWSFYSDIAPPHLDGFLESNKGEFRLKALPDGRTSLEGTTWYRNRMWPGFYWNAWADFAIRRVHLRVLEHIRKLSEESTRAEPG